MTKAILVTVLLSAILLSGSALTFENSSFTEVPVDVLTSNDTTNFQNPFVSRYINSTYIALWGFNTASTAAPFTYNANLRLLFTDNLTANGNDTQLTLNMTFLEEPVFASSTDGYVAAVGTIQKNVTVPVHYADNSTNSSNSTNDTNDTNATNDTNTTNASNSTNTTTYVNVTETTVVAYIFSSDVKNVSKYAPISITLDMTTVNTTGFNIYDIWFHNGYFYVVYTQQSSGVDSAVYLVGFDKDGNTKFSYPLQLNTVGLTGNAQVVAGQGNNTVVAAWKQATQGQIVYVSVDLETSVVGPEITATTDSANVIFTPAEVVFSQNSYVVLAYQTSNGQTNALMVTYPNSNNTAQVDFALDNGYNTFIITASGQYFDGWFIITRQVTMNGNLLSATEETVQIYDYTGFITYPNATDVNTTNSTDNTTNTTDNSTNGTNGTNSTNNTLQSNSSGVVLTGNSTQAAYELSLLTNGIVVQGFTLPNQSYYVFAVDSLANTAQWQNGYIGQVFYKISNSNFGVMIRSAFSLLIALGAFLFMY
eukprot:CAMPEP_0176443660 /NCGR_PEP_ID=MMETSP0127-20121128/22570_1 /TAXON_ID=938130 /ORGANISM="Platyophrya macrostoma, Strain WH" /LENGTH=535 /DNA_ID=CAMNT_0017828961 /DNA_START=22 /DNA_END=1629 /DNA_ORIENTATION=-